MKKSLLLFATLISVQIFAKVSAATTPDDYQDLLEQIAPNIHVPARLMDSDSLVLEISFGVDAEHRLTNPLVKGGNGLLQTLIINQLKQYKSIGFQGTVSGQHFILPYILRK